MHSAFVKQVQDPENLYSCIMYALSAATFEESNGARGKRSTSLYISPRTIYFNNIMHLYIFQVLLATE
jgi:hypothetical protein